MSTKNINSMRHAGKILSSTFDYVSQIICEGVTAFQIDKDIQAFIESHNAIPGFLGYQGYKYSSCISKNEEIVHGIPHPDKLFFDGDLVSIDIGVKYDGHYADAARTFLIGNVSDEHRYLAKITEESFFKGIENIKAGSRLGDLSNQMQTHIESNGLTVVRDLYSHGVGQSLHEEPLIPNYGKKGAGMVLYDGMTMAIEPMVNIGTAEIETLDDKWTIVTQDRKFSAHYENTILVTNDGVEILTICG
jgi:methionyl aminopeptidase